MACDNYPVNGDNIIEITQAHRHEKYSKILDFRKDLPHSLMLLIQKMIEPDPESRPTAQQVITILAAIKREPQQRKKRRLVMGIVGSLGIGFLVSSVALYFADKSKNVAIQEQQKAQAVSDFLQQVLGGASQFGQGRDVRVADLLDWAAKNNEDKFEQQPHVQAAVSEALGMSYQNLQFNEESLKHYSDSLAIKRKMYGDDHSITLAAMLKQAKIQLILGSQEPTLAIFNTVIEKIKDQPKRHNMYNQALVEKANVLSEMRQFEASETIIKEVLNTNPNAGQDYRNYKFLALTVLADNYEKQSKFDQALTTIEKAHEVLLADPNHKPTNELVVLNSKGIILSRLGQLDDAIVNMRKLLNLAEKFYGKNNVGYLRSVINLGGVLAHQGKLQEALIYQKDALKIAEIVEGENSKIGVIMGINLANTYVSLGDVENGEALMRKTLVTAKSSLGENDIETLKLEYNLAELLNNSARYQEAETLAHETFKKASSTLGGEHLITLLTEDNLAISYREQGFHQKAVELHLDLLSRTIRVFGEESPYTRLVWNHLIDTFVEAGAVNKAITQQQSLVQSLLNELSEEHPEVLSAKDKLQQMLKTHSGQ